MVHKLFLFQKVAEAIGGGPQHVVLAHLTVKRRVINKRKKLHGLIARAIEEIYHDRLKEMYELLAFHYEKAEEWEKAAEYYGRAGRKVREIYTEEESNDLFNKKEHAIEKLFQSTPPRSFIARFIFMLWSAFVLLIMGTMILGWVNGLVRYKKDYDLVFWAELFKDILSLCCLWIFLAVLFWLVIPILQRIKLLELMSDRIEIVKGNNKRFSIPFSDIKFIRFVVNAKGSLLKYLYKEADQYNAMEDYNEIPKYKLVWKEILKMAYHIGIEKVETKKGLIHISRKSGINLLGFFLPWFHTLEKSQHYHLSISDPKEFFEQLYVAYEKWKRLNVGSSSS